MQNDPNRNLESSGSADLPRPRKAVTPPHSARPQNGSSRSSRTSGNASGTQNYGSDTMQFRAVQPQPVDTAFEQSRNAQTAPRPQNSQTAHTTPPPPKTPKKHRRKKKKKSFLRRIFASVFVLFAVIFVIYSAAALLLITRLAHTPSEERFVTNGELDASYVTNILLIGTDSRDADAENGRSDTMILFSVNSKSRTIYLSSFMRDAYVTIPGHGSGKLNAAYSFGGPELLMDTLEQNYEIRIDDYVSVSFGGFAGVIDAVGGVEVTLSDSEARAVNEILMSEVNELLGSEREDGLLSGGGTMVLDGKQALSYARIRYVGNADFERTSRQREVMTKLLTQLKTSALTAVPKLISAALPQMTTNMSTAEMYLLSLRVPFCAGYEIQQQQIPADGTWSGETVDGQSVLVVDFEENIELLGDTVYADSPRKETE